MAKSTVKEKGFAPGSKKEHVAGVRPLDASGDAKSLPVFGGVRIEESITIGRPANEIYAYWRDLTNLPKFCKHLRDVTVLDESRSRWVADGPGDTSVMWEATIIEDNPGQLISWRSIEKADFENAGSVRFKQAPGDRGTEVHVSMTYNPPGGPLGSLMAKLAGKEPAVLLREQLRRLKQLMETGEIPTTDGQAAVIDA